MNYVTEKMVDTWAPYQCPCRRFDDISYRSSMSTCYVMSCSYTVCTTVPLSAPISRSASTVGLVF